MCWLDLDEIIYNLEAERRRIEEALEVLRRLHRLRHSRVNALQEKDAVETKPVNNEADLDRR